MIPVQFSKGIKPCPPSSKITYSNARSQSKIKYILKVIDSVLTSQHTTIFEEENSLRIISC